MGKPSQKNFYKSKRKQRSGRKFYGSVFALGKRGRGDKKVNFLSEGRFYKKVEDFILDGGAGGLTLFVKSDIIKFTKMRRGENDRSGDRGYRRLSV